MYRHSLFFESFEDASDGEARVQGFLDTVVDSFLSNDGETGVIEYRFFTSEKLSFWDEGSLLYNSPYISYALNCETY